MRSFDYHRPASLSEVGAALAATPEARLLAGGMTLDSRAEDAAGVAAALVDLGGLAELRGSRSATAA